MERNDSDSEIFSMGRGDFATKMFMLFGRRWLLALFILGIICIIAAAIFDLRIIIVGLALILIVIPAVAAWLYYYYGLRKECFVNILPHKLSATHDGIRCTVFFYPYPDYEDEGGENKTEETKPDTEPEQREYLFQYSMMSPYSVFPQGILLPLCHPVRGFIWLPQNGWKDRQAYSEFVNILGEHIG